jgi:hypothetical protein
MNSCLRLLVFDVDGEATRQRPENLTAYDFYLRARQQFYLATREGLAEARISSIIFSGMKLAF